MSDEVEDRDYYCSMKFRYIKIDLGSQTTYTCHASAPYKVDFEWLNKNQGNLFNHKINVAERTMMLKNQRVTSCEQNCWYAEDRGMQSTRLSQKGNYRTHDQIITKPEIVDITIGDDCNLTCSYCCKEFSSSWKNDISTHGEYRLSTVDNRYKLTSNDRLLLKIKQSNLVNVDRYKILLNEIQLNVDSIKQIYVTGGEPFLNNHLIKTLGDLKFSDQTNIEIYTGLGVNTNRFKRLLDRISNNKNINLVISAEGIEQHLEFNRYGIKWNQFLTNLQSIRDRKIPLKFQSTLTNLTVFGFVDFCQYFSNDQIMTTFAYQPRMMSINVVDSDSKQRLIDQFSRLPEQQKNVLTKSIQAAVDEVQKHDMSIFLSEFVKRRSDLNLDIYPTSFLNWLNIKNVV